jgi:hypothetical protein
VKFHWFTEFVAGMLYVALVYVNDQISLADQRACESVFYRANGNYLIDKWGI